MTRPGFSTRAIHTARYHEGPQGYPVTFPIFQSVSFSYASIGDQLAASEAHPPGSFAYTRLGNPTIDAFERVVADLEGAEAAAAFGSGIAVVHAAMIACVGAGDHMVVTRDVYGGTYHLVTDILPKLGISYTFVDMTDHVAVRAAIQPNTRLLWAETETNPTTVVLDIPALAQIAHDRDLPLGVDATFTSPVLSSPIAQGADLVMHSATKYLSGHGDVLAGIVSGSAALIEQVRGIMTGVGGVTNPLEAFLLLRGVKTLEVRMERHCHNAMALARALEAHPAVACVLYPGLESHPQHQLAQRLLLSYGGMLSFRVRGDQAMACRVVDGLHYALIAGSLGDVDTLASLPVITSHRLVSPADRAQMGVTDNLIRVSVGLENARDLIADFTQALDQA